MYWSNACPVTDRGLGLEEDIGSGTHLSTKIFMWARLRTDLKCNVKMPSTNITCKQPPILSHTPVLNETVLGCNPPKLYFVPNHMTH